MSDEKQIKKVRQNENDPALELAVERTQLALERTHLAWIRTMFTLITAGLAIDKGFEFIHKQRLLAGEALIRNSHFVGIGLTIFSTMLLVVESVLYAKRSRQLSEMKKKSFSFFSVGLILAIVVLLLGITLIALMLFSG